LGSFQHNGTGIQHYTQRLYEEQKITEVVNMLLFLPPVFLYLYHRTGRINSSFLNSTRYAFYVTAYEVPDTFLQTCPPDKDEIFIILGKIGKNPLNQKD
jgi:hypothetical protein